MSTLLSDQALREIEARNQDRHALKRSITPGEWIYESFAFLDSDPFAVPASRRMCILVRPRRWFDALLEKFGHGVLDEGIDTKDMQPYYDADYISRTRSDSPENDVDALLQHIRSLQQT